MKNILSIVLFFSITLILFSCKKENEIIKNDIPNNDGAASAAKILPGSSSGERGAGGSDDGSGGGTHPANQSTIVSNFNGTAIPSGDTVWFNAHLKASGFNTTTPTTIYVTNEIITFADHGTPYSIAVPRSEVTFSSAGTTATSNYDAATDTWYINVPQNYSGDVFFGGVILPSTGLSGGINPVSFQATFSSNKPNVNIDWQWGAAVYTSFSGNYNATGVLPVDMNGRHAGSPMQYKNNCVGGARGGGAANLTGSWSGTGHVITP